MKLLLIILKNYIILFLLYSSNIYKIYFPILQKNLNLVDQIFFSFYKFLDLI